MKKIIIVAALVCAAAISQAATVSWTATGLKNSSGEALTSGMAYVFCTKGSSATTVADVTAALLAIVEAENLTSAQKAANIKTYLTENSLSALNSAVAENSSAGVSGIDIGESGVPASTTGVKLFAVIVDDASFGDGVMYCVTAASGSVKTPADTTTNVANFSIPGSATATAANWQAVPEPTSGLLMLVGLAGLALRRRRA